MSTLTECRSAIVATLEAEGIHAMTYLPETPDPPVALVSEGAPFLTHSESPFTEWDVRWQVLLLVRGDNEHMTTTLDELVARAVLALHEHDAWTVDASEYVTVEKNSARYLGCRLTLTDSISLHPDPEE